MTGMPIYNEYSDNYYDDDDYYIPTHPKSSSSPMFMLKGDESRKNTNGNPYDLNLENNIDKFCEQYLNDKSAFFDKENAFFVLKYNINGIRVPILRTLMLKIKITLLSKIMLMLNLCLLKLSFHLLLPPLSIHPLKIPSLSNLLPIIHPTKILMIFMQFPIFILKGYLLKKLKLTFTWLKILLIMLNLKSLSLHVL